MKELNGSLTQETKNVISDIQNHGQNFVIPMQHEYCTTLGVTNKNENFHCVRYHHKISWIMI